MNILTYRLKNSGLSGWPDRLQVPGQGGCPVPGSWTCYLSFCEKYFVNKKNKNIFAVNLYVTDIQRIK